MSGAIAITAKKPRVFGLIVVLIASMLSDCAIANTGLSLREKIGQMLILGFDGLDVDKQSKIIQEIENENLGGVILFDYSLHKKIYKHNIISAQQLKQLTRHLQEYTKQSNIKHQRDSLPLFIGIDYEGGKVNRLHERAGFPAIPSAAEVAKMSIKDALKVVVTMRQTLNNAAINVDFAPSLDVNINPNNPIIGKIGRSFSSDPLKVTKYAQLYSQDFMRHGIMCAYKHFPGHGSSTTDSHKGFVDISATWRATELIPYKKLINTKDSCPIIMSAHVINRQLDPSGLPATLSYQILTKLLRQKLQFNGLIVTDDLQMQAITDNYDLQEALTLAINAGVDLLLIGNQLSVQPISAHQIIDLIESSVKSGKISSARIDESYQRIYNLKTNANY